MVPTGDQTQDVGFEVLTAVDMITSSGERGDISEKRITSIFRAENRPDEEAACSSWIGRFSTLKMALIR
jgi:hypothetical protein